MQLRQRFLCAAFGVVTAVLVSTSRVVADPQTRAGADTDASFERLTEVLVRHCAACHLESSAEPAAFGAMALDDLIASEDGALRREGEWRRIYSRAVTARSMPPPAGGRVMPDADRATVRNWVERAFGRTAPQGAGSALRRLTNYEYNRSIRDLFGFDFDLEGFIQRDSVSQGFTNAAAVAFSTPERTQQYLAASEFVARAVLGLSDVLTVRQRTWSAHDILAENPNQEFWSSLGRRLLDLRDGVERGQRTERAPRLRTTTARDPHGRPREALRLTSEARFSLRHDFPVTGEYSVRLRAATRDRRGAVVLVHIDGVSVPLAVELSPHANGATTYEGGVRVPRGVRSLRVSGTGGIDILLTSIEVAGPWIPDGLAPVTRRAARVRLACTDPVTDGAADGRACARRMIRDLAARAFRTGSIEETTVDTLLAPFERALDGGADFGSALVPSIQATLMDPRFLYRVEANRPEPHGLDDFEFATRLSYFIWGSPPDEELRRLALERGLVESPPAIQKQVRRMLADTRAEALVDAFAAGWLGYASLNAHVVDAKAFPAFDEELRHAMLAETRLYLTAFFQENWRIGDLFDSRVLFVNQRLARHYGIPGVEGRELRRTRSPLEQRAGLLTQGSILTVTSNSNRTSVVKRGFWILDRVLCQPVGDPPPIVADLETSSRASLTLRQEMERHRANPTCANCHHQIDPLGFSLEHYDPSGAWRDSDKGIPIDPRGTLPGADPPSAFNDFAELRLLLARDVRVPSCVIRKLMIYALGRALVDDDEVAVREIAARTSAGGHRIHDVIAEVALSRPMRSRR